MFPLRTILSFTAIIACINAQFPQVEVNEGVLAGTVLTDREGNDFYAFLSVPYAKPPLNELRFKAPLPAERWEGIRDATNGSIECVQQAVNPTGQEDCLILNVYSNDLSGQTLKPVMVFFHGGAFVTGSSSIYGYGPHFFIPRDVVVVTVNYRLGIFGFFNLDNPELGVTGNAGLKDQAFALKWVKDNIVKFGGDPDNVTIFGESAGGSSAHFHLFSPLSENLFSKAIMQSGTANMNYVMNAVRNNGLYLAQGLGIQTSDLPSMLASLQALPTNLLSTAALAASAYNQNFNNPIVEIDVEGAFITQPVTQSILNGNYHHVPFMIGVNDQEGLLYQMMALQNTGQNVTIEDFGTVIPDDLQIEAGSDDYELLKERIREFYYGDEQPSMEDIVPTVNLLTDFTFAYPSYRAARQHFGTAQEPIYFYFFTADTQLNLMKNIVPELRIIPGAAHADEIGYMFDNVLVPEHLEPGSPEEYGNERMVTMWTNFAKHGTPTPDAGLGFVWEPLSAEEDFKYLHIDTLNTEMVGGVPLSERMGFWQSIYDEFYPNKKH